ncbi:MAG: hypothetical protein WCS77_08380 [Elusimicrobiaceae bacterium]
MKKHISKLAVFLFCGTACAGPYYGVTQSTETGTAVENISGKIQVAASSATANTPAITLDGPSGLITAPYLRITSTSAYDGVATFSDTVYIRNAALWMTGITNPDFHIGTTGLRDISIATGRYLNLSGVYGVNINGGLSLHGSSTIYDPLSVWASITGDYGIDVATANIRGGLTASSVTVTNDLGIGGDITTPVTVASSATVLGNFGVTGNINTPVTATSSVTVKAITNIQAALYLSYANGMYPAQLFTDPAGLHIRAYFGKTLFLGNTGTSDSVAVSSLGYVGIGATPAPVYGKSLSVSGDTIITGTLESSGNIKIANHGSGLIFPDGSKLDSAASPDVRQTVLSGFRNASGAANFISSGSALTINVGASADQPLVIAFSSGTGFSGRSDYVSTLTTTHTFTATSNQMNYIYATYVSSIAVNLNSVSLAPVYGFAHPTMPVANQFSFLIPEMKMYVYNGSVWVSTVAVFLGEATAGVAYIPTLYTYAIRGMYNVSFTATIATSYTQYHSIGANPVLYVWTLYVYESPYGWEAVTGFGDTSGGNSYGMLIKTQDRLYTAIRTAGTGVCPNGSGGCSSGIYNLTIRRGW